MDIKTYKYKVQDREAGNVIGLYYTEDEANAGVVLFENNDKEHGIYTPDFYEIKPLEVEEETRLERLNMSGAGVTNMVP